MKYNLFNRQQKKKLSENFGNQTFLAYFDTTTNKVQQLSSNMIPRRHTAAEVYNNKLYIISGSTTSFNQISY
ncbi:hypothetical protein [Chryseobacterium rhizosphaerae]|uniref:hypothetical protein n=1 Tax=Chryseobacterium rhizosphaerae TaxID=395937 RepID=UPI003D0C408A